MSPVPADLGPKDGHGGTPAVADDRPRWIGWRSTTDLTRFGTAITSGAWVPAGVPHPAFRVVSSGEPTTLVWDPVSAWRTSPLEANLLAHRNALGAQWLLALAVSAAAVAGATFVYGDSQPEPTVGWPVLASLLAIALGCLRCTSTHVPACGVVARSWPVRLGPKGDRDSSGRSSVGLSAHAQLRRLLAVLGATVVSAAIDAGNAYDGYASEGRVPDPGFAKAFALLTLTWLALPLRHLSPAPATGPAQVGRKAPRSSGERGCGNRPRRRGLRRHAECPRC